MRQTIFAVALVFILLVLTIVTWWANYAEFFSIDKTNIDRTSTVNSFLHDVSILKFNGAGKAQSVLKFDSVVEIGENRTANLVRPVLIFEDQRRKTFVVTADHGERVQEDTLNLSGNVTLSIKEITSDEPIGISTDYVSIDLETGTARTQHLATVTRKSLAGSSDGFISYNANGMLNLLSNVELTYDK